MATTDLAVATRPATSRREREINDELLDAIRKGDTERRDKLLEELEEVQLSRLGTQERKVVDLYRAIINCDPERVKALLRGGADPNREDPRSGRLSTLVTAISNAATPQHDGRLFMNLEIIKSLLEYGANPNPSGAALPLVTVAGMAQNIKTSYPSVTPQWTREVALALLRHKADPEGASPYHYAAYEIWPELSKLIEQVKREKKEILAFEEGVLGVQELLATKKMQEWLAKPENKGKGYNIPGAYSLPLELRQLVYDHVKTSTGGRGGEAPTNQ